MLKSDGINELHIIKISHKGIPFIVKFFFEFFNQICQI
jgi:hypothetical protein